MQKVEVKGERGKKVAAETNPQNYTAGTIVMVNEREAQKLVEAGKATRVEAVAIDETGNPESVKATDAAQEKAAKLGVDLSRVKATGSGGQITVQDVEQHHNS